MACIFYSEFSLQALQGQVTLPWTLNLFQPETWGLWPGFYNIAQS